MYSHAYNQTSWNGRKQVQPQSIFTSAPHPLASIGAALSDFYSHSWYLVWATRPLIRIVCKENGQLEVLVPLKVQCGCAVQVLTVPPNQSEFQVIAVWFANNVTITLDPIGGRKERLVTKALPVQTIHEMGLWKLTQPRFLVTICLFSSQERFMKSLTIFKNSRPVKHSANYWIWNITKL